MYASPYNTFMSAKTSKNSRTKLGGPNNINPNKLNQCSRETRDRLFTPENIKSYVGRGVPGPADYKTDRINTLDSNRSTGIKHGIPRVSSRVDLFIIHSST